MSTDVTSTVYPPTEKLGEVAEGDCYVHDGTYCRPLCEVGVGLIWYCTGLRWYTYHFDILCLSYVRLMFLLLHCGKAHRGF
jgi:hypothetical protein